MNGNLENGERQTEQSSHAGKMFLSFLLVAFAFILLFVLFGGSYFGLASLLAPEAIEVFGLEPDEFSKAIADDPNVIWPANLTYLFLGAGALISVVVGFAVSHLARFSRFSHGAILALVTFVTLLQMSLSKPASPQWIINACMLLFPVAIIVGSYLRVRCCN